MSPLVELLFFAIVSLGTIALVIRVFRRVQGKYKAIFLSIILALTLFAIPYIFFPLVFLGSAIQKSLNPNICQNSKGAPEGSVAEREAWGKSELGKVYDHGIYWTKSSQWIKHRIGEVQSIAPVGQPNCYDDYFTDGRIGTLNLEVVGTKGAGSLRLHNVSTCGESCVSFHDGVWSDANGRVTLSSYDMTLAEFNTPEQQIKFLLERKKKNQEAGSFGLSPEDGSKLAQEYFKKFDAKNAEEAQREALESFNKRVRTISSAVVGSQGTYVNGWTDNLRSEYRNYLRTHAIYQEAIGSFDKAAETYKEMLSLPTTNFHNGELRDLLNLNFEHVEYAINLSLAGKRDSAKEELKKQIAIAQTTYEKCWIPIASFFIDSGISEDHFVKQLQQSVSCPNSGEKFPKDAYYYIAQRRRINGDEKGAHEYFVKAVQDKYWLSQYRELAEYYAVN